MKNCLVLMAVLVLGFSASAMAQQQPTAEIAGGYSYVRVNSSVGSINGNGGSGSLAYNPNSWFGIVGDLGGYHFSKSGASGNVFSYLFGPRLSYRKNEWITPFAQVLFGGARATAAFSSTGVSQNKFAMTAGGGLDYKASRHFAIRVIQAEYFMTRFAGERQNNARISTGIVLRIGGK